MQPGGVRRVLIETNPRMSQFLIRSGGPRYLKDKAIAILCRMREGVCDKYEIHGYGKYNIIAVNKLCDILNFWLRILNIETERVNSSDGFIIVTFKARTGFAQEYKKFKERAMEIRKKKEEDARVAEHNAKMEAKYRKKK